jgi:hypothetical protein
MIREKGNGQLEKIYEAPGLRGTQSRMTGINPLSGLDASPARVRSTEMAAPGPSRPPPGVESERHGIGCGPDRTSPPAVLGDCPNDLANSGNAALASRSDHLCRDALPNPSGAERPGQALLMIRLMIEGSDLARLGAHGDYRRDPS